MAADGREVTRTQILLCQLCLLDTAVQLCLLHRHTDTAAIAQRVAGIVSPHCNGTRRQLFLSDTLKKRLTPLTAGAAHTLTFAVHHYLSHPSASAFLTVNTSAAAAFVPVDTSYIPLHDRTRLGESRFLFYRRHANMKVAIGTAPAKEATGKIQQPLCLCAFVRQGNGLSEAGNPADSCYYVFHTIFSFFNQS